MTSFNSWTSAQTSEMRCKAARRNISASTCSRFRNFLREKKNRKLENYFTPHIFLLDLTAQFCNEKKKRFLHSFCFATIEKKLTLPLEKSRNPFFFVEFSMISLLLWPSSSFRSFFYISLIFQRDSLSIHRKYRV